LNTTTTLRNRNSMLRHFTFLRICTQPPPMALRNAVPHLLDHRYSGLCVKWLVYQSNAH